jgi:hypothetical protein
MIVFSCAEILSFPWPDHHDSIEEGRQLFLLIRNSPLACKGARLQASSQPTGSYQCIFGGTSEARASCSAIVLQGSRWRSGTYRVRDVARVPRKRSSVSIGRQDHVLIYRELGNPAFLVQHIRVNILIPIEGFSTVQKKTTPSIYVSAFGSAPHQAIIMVLHVSRGMPGNPEKAGRHSCQGDVVCDTEQIENIANRSDIFVSNAAVLTMVD